MLPIYVADAAWTDLAEIWAFVARDDPSAADHLIASLMESCASLREFPLKGRARDDLKVGLRHIVHGNYIVLYRAREDRVDVVPVLSRFRDIDALLDLN